MIKKKDIIRKDGRGNVYFQYKLLRSTLSSMRTEKLPDESSQPQCRRGNIKIIEILYVNNKEDKADTSEDKQKCALVIQLLCYLQKKMNTARNLENRGKR